MLARRIVWLLMFPLFIASAALWLIGKFLTGTGEALEQGADAIRDELIRFGRVLFSSGAARHAGSEPHG